MAESLHASYNYGAISVWFDHIEVDQKEQPCMILGRNRNGHRSSYIIPLSNAHAFAEDRTLIETAGTIAEVLNLGTDRYAVTRVADIIQNHLEELVRMPPRIEEAPCPEDIKVTMDGTRLI